MRGLVVMLAMMTACAVETPTITTLSDQPLGLSTIDMIDNDSVTAAMQPEEVATDLCALAAELPADDLCSLVCDPDALKQAMVDAGAQTGRCYLLLCQMSPTVNATVGVCLY